MGIKRAYLLDKYSQDGRQEHVIGRAAHYLLYMPGGLHESTSTTMRALLL
jgi:hypothetical protein